MQLGVIDQRAVGRNGERRSCHRRSHCSIVRSTTGPPRDRTPPAWCRWGTRPGSQIRPAYDLRLDEPARASHFALILGCVIVVDVLLAAHAAKAEVEVELPVLHPDAAVMARMRAGLAMAPSSPHEGNGLRRLVGRLLGWACPEPLLDRGPEEDQAASNATEVHPFLQFAGRRPSSGSCSGPAADASQAPPGRDTPSSPLRLAPRSRWPAERSTPW